MVLLCGLSQEPGKQQLYDIPASPRKAERGPPAGQPSVSMTGAETRCIRPAEPPGHALTWSRWAMPAPRGRPHFSEPLAAVSASRAAVCLGSVLSPLQPLLPLQTPGEHGDPWEGPSAVLDRVGAQPTLGKCFLLS